MNIHLSKKLIRTAQVEADKNNVSLSVQLEHWAAIGKLIEDNPDLTYEFIKDILESMAEIIQGKLEPYEFG